MSGSDFVSLSGGPDFPTHPALAKVDASLALLARSRAVLDDIVRQVEEDPTVYEEDVEVLFALAVHAVARYAEALDEPVPYE